MRIIKKIISKEKNIIIYKSYIYIVLDVYSKIKKENHL